MDNRLEFPDPSKAVVVNVEVFSSKKIHMEKLGVEYLRIPKWTGLPENPIGFRSLKDNKPSPDAGNWCLVIPRHVRGYEK